MITTRYKGFRIQTRPYQTWATQQWTVDLEIHRNGRKKPFSIDQHYPTEQEADERCARLGREIIDGSITGWSVDQLRPTGFLRGYRDGHRHRLSSTGSLLIELVIFLLVTVIAVTILSGAYQTP